MAVPGSSNDMKPSPTAQPALTKPGIIGNFLTPPARPQHRLSLLSVYKPKDIDYDVTENTKGADEMMKMDMIKSPLENFEGMKQALADLTKVPLEVADELKEGAVNMMKMPIEKAEVVKQTLDDLIKLPLEVATAMKQAADDLMEKAEDAKEATIDLLKSPLQKAEDAKEATVDLLKLPLEKAEEMKTASVDLMKQWIDGLGTIKEGLADLLKTPMESIPELKPNFDELSEIVEKLVQPKFNDDVKKMITDVYGEKAVLDFEAEFKKAVGLMAAKVLKGDMKNEMINPIIEPIISKVPDDVAEMVEKLVQPKMKEDVKSLIIEMYGEKAVQDLKNEFKRAVGIMASEGIKEDMKMMFTNILSENMVNDIKTDLTEAIPDLMKGSPLDMKENLMEAIMDLVEQGKDSKPDIPSIALPPALPSKDRNENEGMGMKEGETAKMSLRIPEKNVEEPAANDLNVSKLPPPTNMGGSDSNMNSTNMEMGNSTKKTILVDKIDMEEAIAHRVIEILKMEPWRLGRRHWHSRGGGPMSQEMRFKSHERMGSKWGRRSKRAVPNRSVLRRPNLRNEVDNYPPPARLGVPMFTTFRQINSAAPPDPYKRSKEALSLPLLSINEPAINIILDDIKEGLQYALQTRNDITLPIHGTGTTAGNALIDNLVEPGDVVLAAINGYWTELMANMSQRLGMTSLRTEVYNCTILPQVIDDNESTLTCN
ncbi:unnamed protein product [Orchesella dallaii]|uniref:Uncharacterized protein n=1 Tax=Orchesella dallaii TaxID=48710 RepID=A0ABP1R8W0_9HEXA